MVAQVARVLRPGGVYLVNTADRPPLAGARAELATIDRCFADVVVIAEPGLLRGRGYGNLVVAATDDLDLLSSPALARAIRSLPAPARLLRDEELAGFVAGAQELRDGPPLT